MLESEDTENKAEGTPVTSVSTVLRKLRIEQNNLDQRLETRLQHRLRQARHMHNNKPLACISVTFSLLGAFVMIVGKENNDSLGIGGAMTLFGFLVFLCVISPKHFYKICDIIYRYFGPNDLPHLNLEERQRMSTVVTEIKPIAEENHVRLSIRSDANLLALKDQLDNTTQRFQVLEDKNNAEKEASLNEGRSFLANLNIFACGPAAAPGPVVNLTLDYLDAAELKI